MRNSGTQAKTIKEQFLLAYFQVCVQSRAISLRTSLLTLLAHVTTMKKPYRLCCTICNLPWLIPDLKTRKCQCDQWLLELKWMSWGWRIPNKTSSFYCSTVYSSPCLTWTVVGTWRIWILVSFPSLYFVFFFLPQVSLTQTTSCKVSHYVVKEI